MKKNNLQLFHTELLTFLSADQIFSDHSETLAYSYDNSKIMGNPELVVFPTDHSEVEKIIQLCNRFQINITARGKGTGTTGAAVAMDGGVVISTERMNKIIELSIDDRYIVVQPGVTNQEVQDAVAEFGFFWPPDPTSAKFCTIGGNLAYNSAGPRTVKYGSTRDNTLGLKAVSGAGETFTTGSHTTKSVVGYDLTRLLIGSEGTLAFITEAILKLSPIPEKISTIQIEFNNIEDATKIVAAIMAQPTIPYSLEFMDNGAIAAIRDYSDIQIQENSQAIVIVELATTFDNEAKDIDKLLSSMPEIDMRINIAKDANSSALIWKMRKSLSPALRKIAPKKINEDVVVPVSKIPHLIHSLNEFANAHNIRIVNFGHAGNGNIHVNLLVNHKDKDEMKRAEQCLNEIFDLVLSLKGSISGEHGIGIAKHPFVEREVGGIGRKLMLDIKKVFDPNSLLNNNKSI